MPLAGSRASALSKSLTCALRTAKPRTQRRTAYVCILAGGQKPIGNGPVAEVRYRAQWDVKGAPIRVVIEKILGVSADLKRIPIPNVDAIINIP